ncbi:hypothetical protein P4H70_15070 [Paenibacillus ehimensis]|uniref:hypothetical protein n=1 Tax=Paenibacillus ehimensis TaxID=79264 RepID=UPI002DB9E12E|nr:hypothetical protein [Paenibacillus ehimensis]MEC0210258.1 hypothetical protein [Paenibacillus ehimensis]
MSNDFTDGERLIKLETKFELLTQTLTEAITRLEKKLDEREENYVVKAVLEEKLKLRDEKIAGLQSGLNSLRQNIEDDKNTNKNVLPVWLGIIPSIAAVIVAIIALYK